MPTWTKRDIKELKDNPNDYAWDDIQSNITVVRKGTSPPEARKYNFGIAGGVEFAIDGFAVGESVYVSVQTSHTMKLNTLLDNHIHFILPDNTGVGDRFQFQLDVIAAGIGGDFAVAEGSPFTGEQLITDGANKRHALLTVAEIPPMNTTTSTVYECELTRIAASANEYSGEVYLMFNDGHYKKDSDGSYFNSDKLSKEYQKKKGTPKNSYKKGAW